MVGDRVHKQDTNLQVDPLSRIDKLSVFSESNEEYAVVCQDSRLFMQFILENEDELLRTIYLRLRDHSLICGT